jgi:hypothetical protein
MSNGTTIATVKLTVNGREKAKCADEGARKGFVCVGEQEGHQLHDED